MSDALLSIRDVHASYGAVQALRGASLEIAAGEVVALLGANGAGKTTMLRVISGMLRPSAGHVDFARTSALGRRPHELAYAGLLHLPEGRGTLSSMSVEDNLRIAYEVRPSPEPFSTALEQVYEQYPRLSQRRKQAAGSMSGGEQQMLALARALMNPPALLLVDEPSLGLSPLMVQEAYHSMRRLRDRGVAMLLVEQSTQTALGLADRAYVLRHGKVVLSGASTELSRDAQMMEYYVGAH